jgi:hypothetical protein
MTRLRRILLNGLTVLSLLLAIATAGLWVRSYSCADEITYRGPTQAFRLWSSSGAFHLIGSRFMTHLPGFWITLYSRSVPGPFIDRPDWTLRIPFASLIIWLVALPWFRWAIPLVRSQKTRRRPGLCPACGYDMRANPAKCSECGAAPNTNVRNPNAE